MKKSYLTKLLALVVLWGTSLTLTFGQTLEVTAPASVAGTYSALGAGFGGVGETFSGEIVVVTDVDGGTLACNPVDNGATDVTGKIALIDRGGCPLSTKVLNAQDAGAIGAIICLLPGQGLFNMIASCDVETDIPAIAMTYEDCQAIRVETGVMATFTGAAQANPNEFFNQAIPITDGTYTVSAITGNGSLYTDAIGAAFYLYTAAADGYLNINSCGGGADTRLTILSCNITGLLRNDDACDPGDGTDYASNLDFLVRAGETYILHWDDRWDPSGFDFSVTLNPLPAVDVTFTVDMSAETVSGDGVNMVWAFSDAAGIDDVSVLPLADNGDGTWSGTATLTALDTIGYAFMNGALDPANIEAVPGDCGLPSGFGFNIRPLIVESPSAINLGPVCFGTCESICRIPVDVTFTVDMANETVGMDGVNMVWAFSDAAGIDDVEVLALSDNGDGTWSGTATLTALDTIGYAFMNGALDPANIEAVPDDCGLPSGFGFNIRPLIVNQSEDFSVAKVCFGTCLGTCPDEGCATTPTILDNIDSYTLGADVTTQSDRWVLWPVAGVIGGEVTDEQAFSPPHSVKLEGGGSTGAGDLVDPLFNLGGVSTGAWDVRFKLYVPEGGSGYYNIQNNEGAAPTQWNVEVGFETDGNLGEDLEGSGSYPQGEWFDVVNIIDLDNESAEIIINGVSVYTWTYGPDWSIGAFNFYPRTAGEVYYVDDLVMRPIQFNGEMGCPEGAIVCDGFESYAPGLLGPQSAAWTTWGAGGDGGPDDGNVVISPVFEGCNALEIAPTDPDDVIVLLGNQETGRYNLSWQTYIPAGNSGYYNIQEDETPGVGWNLDVAFNLGTSGPGEGINETTGTTFAYPEDQWFLVEHIIDLDNNTLTLSVDGVEVETLEYDGNIGSVDFYGREDNTTYYVDNFLFQALEALPGNACAGAIDIQNLFGQGVDVPVTSGIYDNTNYTSTGSDPNEGWECFQEPGTGDPVMPTLERTMWFSFVGDGSEYYMTTVQCGAPDDNYNADTQIAVYSGDGCGSLTPVACGEDIDLPNGIYEAEVTFATESGVTYYVMVDGFGPEFESFGEYCLEVTQLTIAAVTVTFNVDMSVVLDGGGSIDPAGVHVVGSFNGWTADGNPMTDNGDGTWTTEVQVDPNQEIQYKFINGDSFDGGQEGQGGMTFITDECGVDDGFGGFNRVLQVGDDDVETPVFCFDYCVTCVEVSVDETVLAKGITVFPNPARDLLNVRVDLPEAAGNLSVRMMNAFGQVVRESYYGSLQTANIEIDVTNLPAGAYMIQVMDGKAQFTQSVIVE